MPEYAPNGVEDVESERENTVRTLTSDDSFNRNSDYDIFDGFGNSWRTLCEENKVKVYSRIRFDYLDRTNSRMDFECTRF